MPLEFARKLKYSSEAALKFQRNILEELKVNNYIEVLSYIPYMDEKIEELNVEDSIREIRVKYVLKKKLKNYFKILINYSKELNKMLENRDVVLLYNFNFINLFTLYLAKKNKVKSFVILADHDDASSEKRTLKKILIKIYERNIMNFDGIIFLSESLTHKIKSKSKIIIQGGIQLQKYNELTIPKINNSITIMYSGSIEKVSGIDIYLKSINIIKNEKLKFVFTGKGDLVENVKIASNNDKRIIYKGMVSEEEYYNLLQEANILINCKNMNMGENNNNFPSKVLEYIASGRTIISTKFSGYEKFEENIIFTESNEIDLAKNIENVLKEYEKKYIDYYHKNKKLSTTFSWTEQVMKIEKFISET